MTAESLPDGSGSGAGCCLHACSAPYVSVADTLAGRPCCGIEARGRWDELRRLPRVTLDSHKAEQWSAQAGVWHFVWSGLEDVRHTPGEADTPYACSSIAQLAAMPSACPLLTNLDNNGLQG